MNIQNKQLNLLIGCGLIISCLLALFGISQFGEHVQAEEKSSLQLQQKKEAEKQQAQFNQEVETFYQQIRTSIDEEEALNYESIGISFYDLSNEREISLNGDVVFEAASTTKVALAMLIADMIQQGEASRDSELTYEPEDYEDGTGFIINNQIEKSYSIDTLVNYMLVYSDNIATNMLYREAGGRPAARKLIKEKYLPDFDATDNYLTANQARDLLIQLYENLDDNPLYTKIIESLQQTDFPVRLSTDQTIGQLAHKVGSVNNSIHDIGLFNVEHPYILTFYSTGLTDAEEEISKLSDKIYRLMTQEYPIESK